MGENEGVENLSAEFLSAAFENRAEMKISLYTPVPVDYDVDYFAWGNMKVEVKNLIEMDITYGTKPEGE